ncbi:hypothetical protein [Mucilaginibacter sp. KACC 22063]|uniref:hypothetical protein n=1 Tax=Mucilaginibacter sp. KACC 22063 TaxID=3025666 RepID=UPI0023672F00|nr:hypothetical protein [Mucilaginibacter sp. KACC 22063]WDF56424.1 hypothetical protein PQ461_05085 [Mucilaginibacter sp. KACC 22063]
MTIQKQSARILSALLLLLTFATGQLIVIAHNHPKETYSNHQNKKVNDEQCKICAQNGHLQLFFHQQNTLFTLAVTAINCYFEYRQSYNGIETQHASNRGPPVV